MSFFAEIPLVVSYYTKDTPYEKEVQHLISSCSQFNLEYHIQGVPDRGSWAENCALKPYLIRSVFHKVKRPILWVDADAVFLRPMQFEEFMFSDLALIKYEGEQDPRFSVAAGTVYVNATPGGEKGLDLWCHYADEIRKMGNKAPPFMDQASLYFMLLANPPISIALLPPYYCKIFDRSLGSLDPDKIIIEQRQASRRFKNN